MVGYDGWDISVTMLGNILDFTDTLSSVGVSDNDTIRVHCRLRGGSNNTDIPGLWHVDVWFIGIKRPFGEIVGKMVGCSLAVAALLSCKVQPDRWIAPHLAVAVGTLFDCCRWTCRLTQPVQRTRLWPAVDKSFFIFSFFSIFFILSFFSYSLWPASWLPAVDKSSGSKSVEVQRVWEVCDDRLQFMSRSLVHGLSGLVLLRLHLLMLFGLVEAYPYQLLGSSAGLRFVQDSSAWWAKSEESSG